MVIDYAEKYGINIPVSEESILNEPFENRDAHDDHDELSALLQSATAKLLDGMDMGGSADPSSDSLGLGKLIQESLQNHSASVKDEGPENNSSGAGLLESGGLASLIASKLTDFDQYANSSIVNGNEVPQHGLPQVTQGKLPLRHFFGRFVDNIQLLCRPPTRRSTTRCSKRSTTGMGNRRLLHNLQRTEAISRPIKRFPRQFCTRGPGKQQSPNRLPQLAARVSTRLAGPGPQKRKRL